MKARKARKKERKKEKKKEGNIYTKKLTTDRKN